MTTQIPRSRSEFQTDAEYQEYGKRFFEQSGLEDGFSYLVSCESGSVQKLGRLKREVDKISKSSRP